MAWTRYCFLFSRLRSSHITSPSAGYHSHKQTGACNHSHKALLLIVNVQYPNVSMSACRVVQTVPVTAISICNVAKPNCSPSWLYCCLKSLYRSPMHVCMHVWMQALAAIRDNDQPIVVIPVSIGATTHLVTHALIRLLVHLHLHTHTMTLHHGLYQSMI